jgi:hypothetical protein
MACRAVLGGQRAIEAGGGPAPVGWKVMAQMARRAPIEQHPDIVHLRRRYDMAAANPAAQLADGVTLLAGVYLALSPWLVGFADLPGITVNNLVTGLVVAVLALAFGAAYGRTHGIAWVPPVIGIWTILAPWVIAGEMSTFATVWNNGVAGVVIAVFGLASMGLGMTRGSLVRGSGPPRDTWER